MSNNQAHVGTSALPYIVAKFEGHAIAIKRDADYQAILKALQQYIPKLRSVGTHNIFISATLAEYGDTLVQISGEIWPELVNTLNSIEITTTDPANTGPAMASAVGRQSVDVAALPGEGTVTTVTNWPQDNQSQPASQFDISNLIDMLLQSGSSSVSIIVQTSSQDNLQFDMLRLSTKIKTVKLLIEAKCGVVVALQRLSFLQNLLDDDKTLEESGISFGATINLTLCTRQLAIWLNTPWSDGVFPRTSASPWGTSVTGLRIQLTLNRAWELTTLGSSTESQPQNGVQSCAWVVDLTESGALFDQSSGATRSCLLWDGITQQPRSAITASLPSQNQLDSLSQTHSQGWLQATTTVDPSNSVLIPLALVGSYISYVFTSFGCLFNGQMMSHMLSQLESSAYTDIAFRFLHKAESESLILLDIDPAPASITRITMLYKGINGRRAPTWSCSLNVNAWRRLTGTEPVGLPTRPEGAFAAYVVTWMEVL